MKAIGYAGARLYGCRYAAYSIVVCAPDKKTATEAFVLWLKDRSHPEPNVSAFSIKPAKTLGNRPLRFTSKWRWADQWLQVDEDPIFKHKKIGGVKPGREDEFIWAQVDVTTV